MDPRVRPTCFLGEIDGVRRGFVRVEESEVPLRLGSRLLVLVEHGEDVGLDGSRALGRALPDMVDEVLIVGLRVPRSGGVAASRRPPALGNDDADVPGAGVLERGDEGVDERVEEVLVRVAAVLHDGPRRREERVAEVDLGLVARVGEVRVHVAEQRRPRALQVLRDGSHVPLREAALRRREPWVTPLCTAVDTLMPPSPALASAELTFCMAGRMLLVSPPETSLPTAMYLKLTPGNACTLLCTHVAAALGSEASEERSELGTSMITPMLLPLSALRALVSGK